MEFFHIVNRGVEKRDIVHDDSDRLRFVQDLYILNDKNLAPNNRLARTKREHEEYKQQRKELVHIHAWCLMNNHYHLFLSPVNDNIANLSLFMKKLNMGYAKYFNEKYDRTGYLWQGKYKKFQIERDPHFIYIPYYIHLNPLDYTRPKWREGKIQNASSAIANLRKYRWSSYLDHTSEKNFPSVIDRSVLKGTLGSRNEQEMEIRGIISDFERAKASNFIE